MKHETADEILKLVREAMALLDKSNEIVHERCEDDERRKYRVALSHVYVALSAILNHVHLQYPDLDVDGITVPRE